MSTTISTTKVVTKRPVKKQKKSIRRAKSDPSARRITKSSSSRNSSIQRFRYQLTHPFEHPHQRLGFGSMVPTSLMRAWCTGSISTQISTPVDTQNAVTIVMAPTENLGMVSVFYGTTLTTLAASTVTQFAAVNAAAIQASCQTARMNAGGLRTVIRFPTTGIPPKVTITPIYGDSLANVVTLTPNTIQSMQGSRPVYGSIGAGYVVPEIQYRPQDLENFTFAAHPVNQVLTSNTLDLQLLVVCITGISIGTGVVTPTVEVDWYATWVMEGLFGIDQLQGLNEDVSSESLELGLDDAARATRGLPDPRCVLTDTWDVVQNALDTSRRSMTRSAGGWAPILPLQVDYTISHGLRPPPPPVPTLCDSRDAPLLVCEACHGSSSSHAQ